MKKKIIKSDAFKELSSINELQSINAGYSISKVIEYIRVTRNKDDNDKNK